MFYSQKIGGFYDIDIHGDNIPNDAIELTKKQHEILMLGQSEGKIIQPDSNGYPVLVNPLYSAEELLKIAEANRKVAYEKEADPLFFKSQRGEIDQQVWLDKIAEIKARFPKEQAQ